MDYQLAILKDINYAILTGTGRTWWANIGSETRINNDDNSLSVSWTGTQGSMGVGINIGNIYPIVIGKTYKVTLDLIDVSINTTQQQLWLSTNNSDLSEYIIATPQSQTYYFTALSAVTFFRLTVLGGGGVGGFRFRLTVQEDGVESGGWINLDLGESPAINYQLNDLAKLTDRQASYSQTIKLPKTPNNCNAFGFANIFDLDSDYPYSPAQVRLYYGGVQLIGRNFELQLLRITQNFECQIVSSAIDLFVELADKKCADLDLGQINYTVEGMRAVWQFPSSFYHYWLVYNSSKGMYDGNNPMSTVSPQIFARNIFPSMSLRKLVNIIFEQAGYTLVTNVEQLPGHAEDYITLERKIYDATKADFTQLVSTVSGSGLDSGGWTYPHYLIDATSQINNNVYQCAFIGQDGSFDDNGVANTGYFYTAPDDIIVNLNFSFAWGSTGRVLEHTVRIVIIKRGDLRRPDSYEELFFQHQVTTMQNINYSEGQIELQEGDQIFCTIAILGVSAGTGQRSYNFSFNVTPNNSMEYAPIGSSFELAPNIPFDTQEDVIKAFVNLYGLTLEVKREDQEVHAFTMNILDDNIQAGNYLDWSDKIVDDPTEQHEFTFGTYGQLNRITFAENSDDNFTDVGEFALDNRTLNKIVDIFSFPFMSIKNVYLSIASTLIPIATVPAQEYTETYYYTIGGTGSGNQQIGIRHFAYTGMPLALLRRSLDNPQVTGPLYFSPVSNYNEQATMPLAISFTAQKYLDTYYYKIIQMLKRAKALQIKMILYPSDLSDIDLLKPVYIRHYGAFFYISKIKNYIVNVLTSVNLIKL